MSKKVLALTRLIEITDDIEREIIESILKPVMDNNSVTFLNFWGSTNLENDKLGIEYLKRIKEVTIKLFKANKHRKNYHTLENIFAPELKEEASKDTGIADLCFNKLELACELDAFLVQYKSVLDALIKSLNPFIDANYKTFSRDEKYGFDFIKEILNNKPDIIKSRTKKLCSYVSEKSSNLKKVIGLRDGIVHFESNKLSPFHYSKKEKEIFNPLLVLSDEEIYEPNDFMLEKIKEIVDFVKNFIIFSLSELDEAMWPESDPKEGFIWKIKTDKP